MGIMANDPARKPRGIMTRRLPVLLVLGLLWAAAASAEGASSLFHFRVSNPGARSLGFGGAFAGLADDATAAYANPAGLTQLVDPELSLELRITVSQASDDLPNQDFSGVGFVSFVYPRKRWSVAVYQSALTQAGSLLGDIGFGPNPFFGPGTSGTIDVKNRGLSGAYRWNERFSLGFGIALFEGEFDATSEIREAESPYPPGSFLLASTADGEDLSVNAGFLWNLPRGFNLGGFFRQGPSFVLSTSVIAGASSGLPFGTVLEAPSREPFELANVFGLGSTYRSGNGILTASFEWDRLGAASGLEVADELHLGLEVIVLKTSPVVALRLGVWHDPDRRPSGRAEFPTVVPLGDNDVHTSYGVGLAFENLKLDVGYDQSDRIDTGSFSLVYAF